jgi:hypothetical protein
MAAPFPRTHLQRVFALPGFERLELNVYSINAAAIRHLRKARGRAGGRAAFRLSSERWDMAIFASLSNEAA